MNDIRADAPEVRYAKSGDVSIAYSVVGDGPIDLVFIAGWVLSSLEVAWEGPPAEFFRRLASFSRLILFDKRGTGLSGPAAGIPAPLARMEGLRGGAAAAGAPEWGERRAQTLPPDKAPPPPQ